MNTENSRTNKPHIFRLSLADKFNFKNPNNNIALGNLSIYYTWKNIIQNEHATTINLKFLLQHGRMNLICQMDLILLQKAKTTLNLSLKT